MKPAYCIIYKFFPTNHIWGLLCLWGLLLATSCKDDFAYNVAGGNEPEGVPTTIRLSLAVPNMEIKTRALSEEDARKVNNIWIGIFDATTGERKYSNTFSGEESVKKEHEKYSVDITTKSGMSYIVGVANVETNYGLVEGEDGYGTLQDLLENKALNWDKFKAVSNVVNETNIFRLTANLVMSGIYSELTNDPTMSNPNGWLELNETPVYIPVSSNNAAYEMPGAIHLRRLVSHIQFNFQADANIDLKLDTWEVHNNPSISYLHEQEKDAAEVSTSLTQLTGASDNYGNSTVYHFEPGVIGADNSVTYSFDYYQLENRHTGLDWVQRYSDREKEYKDGSGANTGIYESLCENAESPTMGGEGEEARNMNNFATYVVVKGQVSYWIMQEDVPETDDDATIKEPTIVPANTVGAVQRVGNVSYTIHLGNCDAIDGADKVRDFNCFRNTEYTYNVTIKGVNSIVVEAYKQGEPQPSTEGDVTDAYQGVYELDSHFGVFNIELTNEERAKMLYRIEAPFGNNTYIRELKMNQETQIEKDGINASSEEEELFYKWVEFRPTTGKDIIAAYEPEEVWTLDDMWKTENDKLTHKHSSDANGDPSGQTSYWYTVFINEYVYETGADESGTKWHNYVNAPDRKLWIFNKVPSKVSEDGESFYLNTKYYISQKSISTFYSADAPKAFGVEQVNESYGLNLAWSNTLVTGARNGISYVCDDNETYIGEGRWRNDHGRWNEWFYLSGAYNDRSYSTTMREDVGAKKWGDILDMNKRQSLPAINNQNAVREEEITNVLALKSLTGSDYITAHNNLKPSLTNSTYYEILNACLSRNRDLNGDGLIDKSELRWYLPTSGGYLRLVLGQNSLHSYLMDYNNNKTLPYSDAIYAWCNTRFHFNGSDKKKLYAEEGVSSNDIGTSVWQYPGWEIRCVRDLGTNLNTISKEDDVTPAFGYDETDKTIIKSYYYDQASIRETVKEPLPVHKVNAKENMIAKAFQYYYTGATGDDINVKNDLKATSNAEWKALLQKEDPCVTKFGKGWRVPNQRELTVLRRTGVIKSNNTEDRWLSCTEEYYGTRTMGVTPTISTAISDDDISEKNIYLRCVRDVE